MTDMTLKPSQFGCVAVSADSDEEFAEFRESTGPTFPLEVRYLAPPIRTSRTSERLGESTCGLPAWDVAGTEPRRR